MNAPGEEGVEPVGSRVLMECGHRLPLSWDVAPEAAVAELLHHRAICDALPDLARSAGLSTPYAAWFPSPGAQR